MTMVRCNVEVPAVFPGLLLVIVMLFVVTMYRMYSSRVFISESLYLLLV